MTEESFNVPVHQPGDTKILRITLTQQEWTNLVAACPRHCSLEQYVNSLAREGASKI